MSKKENPAGHLKKYEWKPGVSGNPNGRPIGSKNKSMYTKEAFETAAKLGLSAAEMLVAIASRQFAEGTEKGDALALKAITEANKYIEPTQNATLAVDKKVSDMSEKELMTRLMELTREESEVKVKH
jgi:hypothetical protein